MVRGRWTFLCSAAMVLLCSSAGARLEAQTQEVSADAAADASFGGIVVTAQALHKPRAYISQCWCNRDQASLLRGTKDLQSDSDRKILIGLSGSPLGSTPWGGRCGLPGKVARYHSGGF